jgi:protein-serine/threonine kinase
MSEPEPQAFAADPAMRASPLRASRSIEQVPVGDYPLAMSGLSRSMQDFVVVSEIGRGAYGLVKKVKLRRADGQPKGKDYVIKLIIKSRILADCWRRHRVLGPIPVEIHVMDQLRRLPYDPPAEAAPWSPHKLFPGTPAMSATTAVEESPVAHPNLAQMLDFFEDHEFYYLVMPCFGKGQDLFDFVESAPDGLDARHVRCICGQVAGGLRYLHANNIVHRDIKDENVILDGRGHAQIIDFGSAAHIKPGRLFDTFSGTLDYAAAEILQGEKYSGKPQDIWALGVVLYVMMCGECPFWNGEEAVAGLAEGTRAKTALEERCMLGNLVTQQANDLADLGDTDEQLTRRGGRNQARNLADDGQPDGGGKLVDGADLVERCLSLDLADRPTAEQVCTHRFLIGTHGWHGPRGWERMQQE